MLSHFARAVAGYVLTYVRISRQLSGEAHFTNFAFRSDTAMSELDALLRTSPRSAGVLAKSKEANPHTYSEVVEAIFELRLSIDPNNADSSIHTKKSNRDVQLAHDKLKLTKT